VKITIGGITFDHHHYDERGEGEITITWPEGHVAADSLAPVLTAA